MTGHSYKSTFHGVDQPEIGRERIVFTKKIMVLKSWSILRSKQEVVIGLREYGTVTFKPGMLFVLSY